MTDEFFDHKVLKSEPARADMDEADILTWDDSYAIARALQALSPHVDLAQVSLNMIYRWTLALPQFTDDPQLANDAVLAAIYQEWFEEVNPV